MADDRYDKVSFRGVTVDKYTRAALLAVEKDLGYELTLWQGSYHKGVSKSAGTHDGGGVVDLNGYFDATNKVKALRRHGFVADLRNQPSLSMEIHAVQIGNTKVSASAKAQIGPMIRGEAGLARRVTQVIKYTPPGGYKAFNYNPIPPKPKPVPGPAWFTIGTFNLKAPSLTLTGAHRWTDRRDKIVSIVRDAKLDVLCAQETGSGDYLDWYDREFKREAGLVRVPGGSDWRHIWVRARKGVVVLASGYFQLAPLYQHDTKQAAWAILEIDGETVLVTSMHLEEANGAAPDAIRVKQADDLIEQSTALVAKYGDIPRQRWFMAGDTNSAGLVPARMAERNLVPASTNAIKTSGSAFASLNNWISGLRGGSVDYIFIGTLRPVTKWSRRSHSIASDHNLTWATVAHRK